MAKRGKRRGALDPDYRRKGWNKSTFAPKNSSMTMTGFAFGIPFMLWALLWWLPETRPFIMGPSTWYWACGGGAILGMVIFIITRRLVWRKYVKQSPDTQDE
jgi:hypothetical protein